MSGKERKKIGCIEFLFRETRVLRINWRIGPTLSESAHECGNEGGAWGVKRRQKRGDDGMAVRRGRNAKIWIAAFCAPRLVSRRDDFMRPRVKACFVCARTCLASCGTRARGSKRAHHVSCYTCNCNRSSQKGMKPRERKFTRNSFILSRDISVTKSTAYTARCFAWLCLTDVIVLATDQKYILRCSTYRILFICATCFQK